MGDGQEQVWGYGQVYCDCVDCESPVSPLHGDVWGSWTPSLERRGAPAGDRTADIIRMQTGLELGEWARPPGSMWVRKGERGNPRGPRRETGPGQGSGGQSHPTEEGPLCSSN